MYLASNAFHEAVANGAHQIALLIFDDAVFTNDDIDVSAGIEFHDYFNTAEDLSVGQALSNEISFSIFNDEGLLNEYEFGEFLATIGAQTGNETITASGIRLSFSRKAIPFLPAPRRLSTLRTASKTPSPVVSWFTGWQAPRRVVR